MLGARDGVCRHTHGVWRQQLGELAANAALDRAHIADDSTGRKNGSDRFQQIGIRAERSCKNEQIGTANSFFKRARDAAGGKKRTQPVARPTTAVVERQRSTSTASDKVVSQRTADVSNTDDADILHKGRQRLRHDRQEERQQNRDDQKTRKTRHPFLVACRQ